MSATISIVPDTVWTDPDIDGLDVSEDVWELEVSQYEEFLLRVTGISVADGLSSEDCYRIGNRLQAQIEQHKRQDEWDSSLLDTYPSVSSLDEFLWLSRFFRGCHDSHDANETCFSGDSRCQSV